MITAELRRLLLSRGLPVAVTSNERKRVLAPTVSAIVVSKLECEGMLTIGGRFLASLAAFSAQDFPIC